VIFIKSEVLMQSMIPKFSLDSLSVMVFCGGQSAEHSVSILSAKNVIRTLLPTCAAVNVIFISKNGRWILVEDVDGFLQAENVEAFLRKHSGATVSLVFVGSVAQLVNCDDSQAISVDVVLPMLHGAHGEDGTMQGLLEMANIPFVGSGVLASAVAMDKDVAKCLLEHAGLPVCPWVLLRKKNWNDTEGDRIIESLGLPLFVKPANTGSSLGISKATSKSELLESIAKAFQYDHKVLVEKAIVGREFECAVLGNENPQASLPGEIVVHHDFYSYEAKYLDEQGATIMAPAENLSDAIISKIQQLAVECYQVLNCEGMARVDFFVTKTEEIFLNEINTIPGFTDISLYPKLWRVAGMNDQDLLAELIRLALARFERDRQLCSTPKEV